jgi:hypothetical protein
MPFRLRAVFIVDPPQKYRVHSGSAGIARGFEQLAVEHVGQVAAPFARPPTAEGLGIVRQVGSDSSWSDYRSGVSAIVRTAADLLTLFSRIERH